LSPHCWQNANAAGVAPLHRGHWTLPLAPGGAVGMPAWPPTIGGGGSGPGGSGPPIGPPIGGPIPIAGDPGVVTPPSTVPQLRQNFMPGGFSPRHVGHMTGNPGGAVGVCA
jgi:hypothetical protein